MNTAKIDETQPAPEYPARVPDEIPAAAIGRIHARIEASLGELFSIQFPEFAKAFPLTAPVIDQYWSPMVLTYRYTETRGQWYQRAMLESRDDRPNLIPDILPASNDPYRDTFAASVAMLPVRWRELYRWFNGIGLASPRLPNARTSHLLPVPYEGRKDSADFLDVMLPGQFPDRYAAKKTSVERFCQPIGEAHPYPNGLASEVQCWCMTDQADSLWIPYKGDGTVYHVRGDEFDDGVPLGNPEDRLDEYMALLLEKGTSEGYDFRR